MNIFVPNQMAGQGAAGAGRHGARPQFQTGDIISALLADISGGRATLMADGGFSFTADASQLDGQVGDTLSFSVTLGRGGMSLTQVGRPSFREAAQQAERGRATLLDGYAESKDMISNLENIKETEELRAEHRREQSAKVAKAVAQIRRAQSFMSGVGRDTAISALIGSGMDISKISFADFSRVMQNIDRRPETPLTEEDLAAQARRVEGSAKSPENARHIAESLYNNGLEINEKNAGALQSAYEKLPQKMEEPAIARLIRDDADLTLDNVYKSRYSAAPKVSAAPAPWEALQDAIMRLFQREGLQPSDENLRASRFLLDRDLPLTRGNIERVLFLEGMADNIPRDAFFNQAASYMAHDRPVGSMILPEIARLAEIQLKFAQKSVHVQTRLGIDLEPLRQQVKKLNLLEADAARYLRMVGGDIGGLSLSRMTDLFERLGELSPTTVNVHGGIMKGQTPFTIDAVHKSVQIAKANQMYEQYATVPNPRMGDTFQRVKNLFAPLLEGMNIRATNENLKASFILSKNEMDVNNENLKAVKEIETKITAVATKLHPVIAANMVKDGLNPLEMHVDEVLAYIGKFGMGKGFDSKKKIASHILDLDESGAIDPETRKSMLAMYRMLGIIRKDGARVLGLAAEMGASVTLGELMEMSKNFKKIRAGEAVDIEVDEKIGELEAVVRPDGNIRGAVEAGIGAAKAKAPSHIDMVIDSFIDAAAPGQLGKMMQSPDEALEDIAADAALSHSADRNSERLMDEQIRTFLQANPQIVHFLNSRGISSTAGHIRALEHLTRSHRALAQELGLVADEDGEVAEAVPDTGLGELKNGGTLSAIFAKILDAVGLSGKSRNPGNRNVGGVESLVAVTHGLNGDGKKGFQLPVRFNGGIANLQLYVLNEKALKQDGAKILLSLDTASLGIVTAYFSMTKGALDLVATAGDAGAVRALESCRGHLAAALDAAGIRLASFSTAVDTEAALETSLPPDAIEDWAGMMADAPRSAHDYRA